MSTKEKTEYYSDTFNREVRSDLVLATSMIDTPKIAIDCGCGSGSDIAYLREHGFIVHAFDVEEESIQICSKRFKSDKKALLSKASFSSFEYPKSSLIVADASLFFCPELEFKSVWAKMVKSLNIDGIFCGSFLGPEDTMATDDFNKDAYWSDVLVFEKNELLLILNKFDIIKFEEHKVAGKTPRGIPHNWHIYAVVAKKR